MKLAIVECLSLLAAVSLCSGEEIVTSFGGQRVTLEIPAEASFSGITPSDLVGLTRYAAAARPLVIRDLVPDSKIAAYVAAKELLLDGRIAVGVTRGVDPYTVAAEAGLRVMHVRPGYVVLATQTVNRLAALRQLPHLAQNPAVVWSEPVVVRQLRTRDIPTDPRFAEQWFLNNTGQVPGALAGNDLNVTAVWPTITGVGVRVGVVDTGVLLTHEDLSGNIVSGEGHDFIDNDAVAMPGTSFENSHGTVVAGLIAAQRNTVGGVGVAYGATIVPLRLIGGDSTTQDTADALTWQQGAAEEVVISNNSWGPGDDGIDNGAVNENPSTVEAVAIQNATAAGRGNKGTIFVWACGNGAGSADSCDRDGYANSRFVIAVGATNGDGKKARYSEMGSCVLVNAPVGDSAAQKALSSSCDPSNLSQINLYDSAVGTSFSTPMVAGVIALMLEANPALTWRDVRDILAKTAAKNDPGDSQWLTNGAGLHWNLKYGFGRVDAAAAVAAAQDGAWVTLPAEATALSASIAPNLAIPDAGTAATVSLAISGDPLFRCETVEITLDATHPRQGQLAFTLISPRGTAVNFLARANDVAPARVWTMSSVASWGEDPTGTWQVIAHDVVSGSSGTLNAVTVTIHGHVLSLPSTIGTGTATVVSAPIITANGATAIPPSTVEPTPKPSVQKNDDDGGCGLGAGSLGMWLPALLLVGLRRNKRR